MTGLKLSDLTVTFKSSAEWYELERQGAKPCTVRLMSEAEAISLAEYDPLRICVQRGEDEGTCFTRTVQGIYRVGGMLGQALVLVCWEG
jgi:hypothetical protein